MIKGIVNYRLLTGLIDEQIVFGEIQDKPEAIWSLLMASGYLKVVRVEGKDYELELTNHEVREMFERMVHDWFGRYGINMKQWCREHEAAIEEGHVTPEQHSAE